VLCNARHPEDAPDAFQAGWNTHDMAALGKLFHDDATFANRFGHHVRGVDAIVALHVPIHQTIYSDSSLDNELIRRGPGRGWSGRRALLEPSYRRRS
jgi:uncharacterized protein (TIGR02246 family)